MLSVDLYRPQAKHEALWKNIISEFLQAGEKVSPYSLHQDTDNYQEYLEKMEDFAVNRNIPSGKVPSDTYFLMDEGESVIIGAVNIRHWLNEDLLQRDGNIGYGIRPSERRKGYAAKMLALALSKCRELGMDRVLVTCNKDNRASAGTIMKNGGILENEFIEAHGNVIERYWIYP